MSTFVQAGSLGDADEPPDVGERTTEVVRGDGFRVEVIASGVVNTPVEFIQAHDEWVLVLEGAAVIDLGGTDHELATGDWLFVPAGAAHRLVSVQPGTHWLAVHDLPPGG